MKRPKLYGEDGRPVLLGAELGSGGEGKVFEASGQDGLAAKIYHKPPSPDRSAKLAAMVRHRSESLLKISSWPVELLHDAPGGPVSGLLMPRISAYNEIHTLYGPKSRLAEFPHATWKFLVHAAANVARAVAVIHEHGHVVGDINHGNILVSEQATVRLIDCDSFQITDGARTYRCEVGVPTHTPPELQGLHLGDVSRTPNHDAFGLAVVIFQLLFMARHPFSGMYLGSGDMPIEKAIQELRFAYGSRAAVRLMRPPPHTLSLTMVSEPLARLFERAFSPEGVRDGGRPGAREWVTALEGLKLRTCPRSRAHHYVSTLAACPWCEIETRAGTLLFNVVGQIRQVTSGFDLQTIWLQILAVPDPGPAPLLMRPATNPTPSPAAVAEGRKRRIHFGLGLTVAILGSGLGLTTSGLTVLMIMAVAISIGFMIVKDGEGPLKGQVEPHLRELRIRAATLESVWRQEAGANVFHDTLRDLEKKRLEHQGLATLRQRKINELHANLRNAQLHRFLDRHRIENADLKGIGEGRKAVLESYGIETAADVIPANVMRVPGFGPALTEKLFDWRKEIERSFVFLPTKGVDPADLAALERSLATTRNQLEKDLQNGPARLRQAARLVAARRQSLHSQMMRLHEELAQAEADFEAL
jgi:DNA-binding helix-hairpin-helix protein with protein kinase domain